MPEYRIKLGARTDKYPPPFLDAGKTGEFLGALKRHVPTELITASVSNTGYYEANFAVEAPSLDSAIVRHVRLFRAVAEEAGLPAWPISSMEEDDPRS
jgi:hypothetical protein